MKITIVDDDPFVVKLMTRQLASLGFPGVVGHLKGQDAVTALEADSSAFDLLICDLQMPEMDGVELIRHLGTTSFAGSLLLTSGEDRKILETAARFARAHGLHVVGALPKPLTADDLAAAAERHGSRAVPRTRPAAKGYSADELRSALLNRELINYYQPKVDVSSGVLLGVESLVRWRHPRDGMVFPDQFIGVAEQHGLIDDLTQAVLAEALRQARLWNDAGLSLSVAVNVSLDNLANLRFPEFVVSAAHDAGVPLAQLVLEVTESRLAEDIRGPMDVLTRLRLKRVRLSIDDFGTGHSSLAQLRDFPFCELKIDRGFVHGACRDASLRAIFEASRQLARELGMKIVAEGVEDRADWDFLRAHDCDMAQGYFIAKPMPGPDVMGWANAWEDRRLALMDGPVPVSAHRAGAALAGASGPE